LLPTRSAFPHSILVRALKQADLKTFLDEKVEQYNVPGFIELDPVSIPHLFSKKQDIEIAGLFSATLAWGQRKTIINNCTSLMDLMDRAPHQFVTGHSESDLRRFEGFCHRTFNTTDLLYFIHFLSWYYRGHDSLEWAFTRGRLGIGAEEGLMGFHELVFSLDGFPPRTKKHVSTPARKSACKRLNMFLRWMVRSDKRGVDFGLWKQMSPSALVCPCDVHVERVARKLKLIRRKQFDWLAAVELTENLKAFDPHDPVKYDFALFGLGLEGWA
jgi:uncharacterized protein (TIGR02757 family)